MTFLVNILTIKGNKGKKKTIKGKSNTFNFEASKAILN